MEDMADIFSKVDKGGDGVCVQVSLAVGGRRVTFMTCMAARGTYCVYLQAWD